MSFQNYLFMRSNRAYISDEDKIISGVCGGMADNFNIDPTIVRILFLVVTFITGLWIGCLAYYILTLLMPVREDGTWSERHSSKKVKNMFLYSIIVIAVYSPLLLLPLYILSLILGISCLCLI